jgi:hypothetical protein
LIFSFSHWQGVCVDYTRQTSAHYFPNFDAVLSDNSAPQLKCFNDLKNDPNNKEFTARNQAKLGYDREYLLLTIGQDNIDRLRSTLTPLLLDGVCVGLSFFSYSVL